ncbi:MAG TPA: carbohydrate kinase family protein [Feifaniaceae bacterium]|nr:carbohydrate kinase family protein [Feifaniaceae bacterium]
MENCVFGFGTATLDFRIQTADFGPGYKEKLLARKTICMGGGSAANALTQVARLGCKSIYLGKLGNDILGERIIASLETEGIDCGKIIRSNEHCSPFNLAAYAGEEMRRSCGFLIPNSLVTLTGGELAFLAGALTRGSIAMVEVGEIPLKLVADFCALAKRNHAKIVVDLDLDPARQCVGTKEEFERICSLADILMPNAAAMTTLYPERTDIEIAVNMHEEFKKPVIMSAGGNGAYYIDDAGALRHKPAYRVEVADTVGAGDAFHGGVAYALSRGADMEEAVTVGNLCGAHNCRVFGTRGGMPTWEELEAFRKEVGA